MIYISHYFKILLIRFQYTMLQHQYYYHHYHTNTTTTTVNSLSSRFSLFPQPAALTRKFCFLCWGILFTVLALLFTYIHKPYHYTTYEPEDPEHFSYILRPDSFFFPCPNILYPL